MKKRRVILLFQIICGAAASAAACLFLLHGVGVIRFDGIYRWLVPAVLLFSLMLLHVFTRVSYGILKKELAAEQQKRTAAVGGFDASIWEYRFSDNALYSHITDEKGRERAVVIPNFRETLVRANVHPDHYATIDRFFDELPISEDGVPYEFRCLKPDGEYGWYQLTAHKTYSGKKLTSAFIRIVNIDAEYARRTKLNESASSDSLTGTLNRSALEANVAGALTAKSAHESALAVISIDGFADINERMGTRHGNALLIALAAALGNVFPETCVIGRAGDEFVAFIPEYKSRDELCAVCRKAAGCLSGSNLLRDSGGRTVGCTVGVSRFPEDGSTYEELFFKADTALCAARLAGERCRLYCDGMENDFSAAASSVKFDAVRTSPAAGEDDSFHGDNIIDRIIEILFDSRDFRNTFGIILSVVGHKYSLDHACIYEFSYDFTTASMSYEWTGEGLPPVPLTAKHLPMEFAEKLTFCIGSEYFACDDLDGFISHEPDVLDFYRSIGTRSLLQCPVLDGGICRGMINFCSGGCRKWTRSEINELLLISKIVGGYIVKLRTQLDMNRSAYTDKLTGAWTMDRFISEGQSILAEREDRLYCVIYTDIDRFKFINEKYGYTIGNELLIRFSETLKSSLRDTEIFARAGADHFVVLLEYESDETTAQRIDRFNDKINSIKRTDNSNYKISSRAGIYVIPEGRDCTLTSAVDKAIIACKDITISHKSQFAYFSESMKTTLAKQDEIENSMQDALNKGEFVVYYQPKFALSDRRLVGAEALVRWNRPNSGLVAPADFVPIFEENGFITKIDFFVLESVCRKLRRDIDDGLVIVPISVNFSRAHLNSPDFIDRISECITKYGIPSNLIEIEITESALIGNEDYLLEIMKALHRLGLVVSMDDFGSGFSSLNLLKKLPFDVLKIDKEFFSRSGATDRERTIITNVVNMAKSLDIRVVSEGVETGEQADFLRTINCDQAQGFLYARPMDEESFRRTYQQPQSSGRTDGEI